MSSVTFENCASHGRTFNAWFSTVVTMTIVGALITFLVNINFFNSNNLWVIVVLALAVIIVAIAEAGNHNLRAAYYKTWQDRCRGFLDRKKILQSFAKQYNIETYKIKVEDIHADGRWHFRIKTLYNERLAEERDFWLGQLYQEYGDKITEIDKKDNAAKGDLNISECEITLAQQSISNIKSLIEKAKSADEVYYQRKKLQDMLDAKAAAEKTAIGLRSQIEKLRVERKNFVENFLQEADFVLKFYNSRYSKYSESAIKTINLINNLHYSIEPMPENLLEKYRKEFNV